MKVADFDFFLPENLIAERPSKERAGSRLLVLHRDGKTEHKRFSDIPSYLNRGDILLINNTKVFPARLTGFKKNGGRIEILLVRARENNTWEVLSKGRFTGTVKISEELQIELDEGNTAHFECSVDLMTALWKYGKMPLPPYIRRSPDESDKESYQTVFAKKEGSIAAPTAGLHFTDELLKEIISKGIILKELTLHVGTGTFRPMRTENVEEHSMYAEYFEMDRELISEIKEIKSAGNKVVSVGTTTTRAIEGYASSQWSAAGGKEQTQDARYKSRYKIHDPGYTIKDNNAEHLASGIMNRESAPETGIGNRGSCIMYRESKKIKGYTNLFIYPGYDFRIIDSLITNFHLPRSTPLMLASAFSGLTKLLKAYEEAVAQGYRFLSYGDAMLIL